MQPGTAAGIPGNCKRERWVLCPPQCAVLLPLSRHVPRRTAIGGKE